MPPTRRSSAPGTLVPLVSGFCQGSTHRSLANFAFFAGRRAHPHHSTKQRTVETGSLLRHGLAAIGVAQNANLYQGLLAAQVHLPPRIQLPSCIVPDGATTRRDESIVAKLGWSSLKT